MRPFRHTFTRAWPRRSMWLRATSTTRVSSTRLALRCISRPARNTARTLLKMVASYSSSGLNDPRKRLPISATSSSPKKQLSENAHRPHLAGDFLADARPEFSCRDFSCLVAGEQRCGSAGTLGERGAPKADDRLAPRTHSVATSAASAPEFPMRYSGSNAGDALADEIPWHPDTCSVDLRPRTFSIMGNIGGICCVLSRLHCA